MEPIVTYHSQLSLAQAYATRTGAQFVVAHCLLDLAQRTER